MGACTAGFARQTSRWPCLPLAVCLIFASVQVSAEDVFKLINSGDAAISRGELTAAVKAYSDAIALDSKQMLAYTKRAAAYVASHKHSLATRDLAAALELEPSSVTVLLKKGQLELQLCNFQASARDFQSIMRLRPDHKAAAAGIESAKTAESELTTAQAFLDAKDVPQADAAIKAVFKISTDCLQARQMSAEMFMLEEKHEEAVAESGRILKMDPGNVPALLLRARAYYMLQDFDMAKRHYGEVLTKYDPDNKAAKTSFKELKALQRRIDSATKAIAARSWKAVDQEAAELLHALPETLTKVRSELWMGLALSRFHQRQSDETVIEAADAVLFYGYNSAAVEVKMRSLIRSDRWEAAIQAGEAAMEEHGRTQALLTLLQEAQKLLKISKQKDYYKVLGVPRDVEERTLKKAYRVLALKFHPDKVDASTDKGEAEKKFAEINEAYEILSNAETRELHDRGEDPLNPNAGHGGGHGFGGGFPGGGFHGGQRFNVRFG